jgi:predicted nucleic acid-binding protein
MVVSLDTNVLAYAEDVNGAPKRRIALDLLQRLPPESTLIAVQALAELFSVLVKKAGWSRERARDAVNSWSVSYPLIDTSSSAVLLATELTVRHQLGWWDAVILSTAAEARCRIFLSEDLQEGFTWSGVMVINPFAPRRHPLLDAVLS